MRNIIICLFVIGCSQGQNMKDENNTNRFRSSEVILPGINQRVSSLYSYNEDWSELDLIKIPSKYKIVIDNNISLKINKKVSKYRNEETLLFCEFRLNDNVIIDSIKIRGDYNVYVIKKQNTKDDKLLSFDLKIDNKINDLIINYTLYKDFSSLTIFDTYLTY